ncbi:hypothetical protein J7413_15185 [Shimia sp. R10_1]|uniref:hypothetical protein n=1 Tax=Shimia sp. R10_1 TaxID=2821095 RepID=UPI001ADAAB3A|nr:hypothetical protein [Shimia sp. R10_1]MBO9474891.1 hypothetical protein [Shimia sp. R10_1]
MSDAVTNTEIEDVLTSIRRLVSDNKGAEERADGSAVDQSETPVETQTVAEEAVEEDAPEALMLVLTPALRVADAEDAGSDTLSGAIDSADEFSFEEALAEELRADIHEAAEEAGDVASGDAFSDDDPLDAENVSDALPEESDAHEAREWLDADSTDHGSDEGAFEPPSWQEEPDVSEGTSEIEDASPHEDVDEEQPFDFQQVLEQRIRRFQHVEDMQGVEDVVAEVEESDAEEFSAAVSGAAIDALEDTVQEQVVRAIHAPAEDAPLEDLQEPAEIDEAMLRDMVADIVRQELQGALGERITRNVRKLVRREIHRALAAHDLG